MLGDGDGGARFGRVVAFVLGVVCALVFALRTQSEEREEPVWLWVADREGWRVVGLDATLRRQVELRVSDPRLVASTAGGGIWVALAAIQGLFELVQQQARGLSAQNSEIAALRARLTDLENDR